MADPVSILIIDNSFTFGGAINSLENLLKALDKASFRPVVVSGQPLDYLKKHFPGCRIHHFLPRLPWINNAGYERLRRWPLFQNRVFRKGLNLSRYLYWFFRVHIPEAIHYYRLGKREGVELVHLNNILGSQLSGILAARLLRVPCMAHLRDFEEIHPITRMYARWIQQHVAISSAIADNLRQLEVPSDNIQIVHDALDLTEFHDQVDVSDLRQEFALDPTQLCYGLFGRIVPWKGVEEFVHATRRVADVLPEARAFVVGGCSDGDEAYLQRMETLVRELGLERQVVFTGFRSDVPALMKMMDVVVHASTRPEPFGMVVIEGMAMGKPVVATRGGGPLDIVEENQTGLLVDIGDAEALAEGILRLLNSEDLREQMGRKGRLRVEQAFSNRLYAAKMETMYRKLTTPSLAAHEAGVD